MGDTVALITIVVGGTLAFMLGRATGASQQAEAETFLKQSRDETDPIKRAELLLKWNELTRPGFDRRQKKMFKQAMLKSIEMEKRKGAADQQEEPN